MFTTFRTLNTSVLNIAHDVTISSSTTAAIFNKLSTMLRFEYFNQNKIRGAVNVKKKSYLDVVYNH